MLLTKEHYELMAQFEKAYHGRMDKEEKADWSRGIIYQDGKVNEMFKIYRAGFSYGKFCGQQDA